MSDQAAVVAVDVGGTGMKGALVGEDGRERVRLDRRTPVADGPDAVVAAIRKLVSDLAKAAKGSVDAAGVIVPGVVDPVAGVARYAANLGWTDVPLRALLEADLGVPVVIDHDVRAAGVAEAELGRARGFHNALFLPIGTGIAAAIILDGHVLAGATGTGGEIGHMSVFPDGEQCGCGQIGCLESYASASSIARRYAASGGLRGLSTPKIIARAETDPIAGRVWSEAVTALGIALAAYTMLLDPALIVLGGGLARAGETLRAPVQAALASRLTWRPAPPVELALLGADAGRVGAAILAWRAAGRVDLPHSWSRAAIPLAPQAESSPNKEHE